MPKVLIILSRALSGKLKEIQKFCRILQNRMSRAFEGKITERLCKLSDESCTYSGDTLVDSHVGMGINENDFNRRIDLLFNAMDKQFLPHRMQNPLMTRLALLRSKIIYR